MNPLAVEFAMLLSVFIVWMALKLFCRLMFMFIAAAAAAAAFIAPIPPGTGPPGNIGMPMPGRPSGFTMWCGRPRPTMPPLDMPNGGLPRFAMPPLGRPSGLPRPASGLPTRFI